ncbi:SpoIIE family protein phosphatase, partial [uncultured Nocardioides sp.]|uniref:SpoIIE family protein phosphatase n=1 Tax=uncultured Nocardioides sp. TaxID=198441 RepID=UPI0025CD752C
IKDATERVRVRRAAEDRAARAETQYAEVVDLVRTLQDTMLPGGVPILPRVQVAATYLPAQSDTTAGGDWLDSMPLPGGRWAFMVGDVVGHGVEASATMGRLRAALRTALCVHDDPAGALDVLERYAETDPAAASATVVVAVLDPVTGALEYCTAGHPPPLHVPESGEARFLALTGAGPLGSNDGFSSSHETLAEGDLLLLYSDGIVERPGRTVMDNQVELLHVVTDVVRQRPWQIGAPAAHIENTCQTALELLVRETGHADDVTLLAVQRSAEAPRFAVTDLVDMTTPARVRTALGTWLTELGIADLDVMRLQHAIGELVTNVADHAYPHADSAHETPVVEVEGALTPEGSVELSVRDFGRWQAPDPAVGQPAGAHGAPTRQSRGRGLAMARRMLDDLSVDEGLEGTVVHVRHRVHRPVTLRNATAYAGRRQASTEAAVRIRATTDGLIEAEGPVDAVGAEVLDAKLLQASRGGVQPVVVDLGGVTHLSSAGIRVLLQFLEDSPDSRLRAGAGTVAQHVLSIAQIEHEWVWDQG